MNWLSSRDDFLELAMDVEAMDTDLPDLDGLLRRLSECPPDFLATPPASPDAVALVCDLVRHIDSRRAPETDTQWLEQMSLIVRPLRGAPRVAVWLLRDRWFAGRVVLGDALRRLFTDETLVSLDRITAPELLVRDPDRREELVRVCLRALGLRPRGETLAEAADRLAALDSVERERVLRATAAAERRAREIREAMARQAALDAASRYGE